MSALSLRASLLSGLILLLLLGIWHLATLQPPAAAPAQNLTPEQIEYLKLQGKDPTAAATRPDSGFPTPSQMAQTIGHHLSDPFYDNGPNDKGIGGR